MLLKERHHVGDGRETIVVCPFVGATGRPLGHVPNEIVVAHFPGRIEDEGGDRNAAGEMLCDGVAHFAAGAPDIG